MAMNIESDLGETPRGVVWRWRRSRHLSRFIDPEWIKVRGRVKDDQRMGTGAGHVIPPISITNEWTERKRRTREREDHLQAFSNHPRITRTGVTLSSI